MKGDMAAAVRDGKVVIIAADDLRVGDLVLIQAGNTVPADLKLLETSDLEVDEFEITGEIIPVPKSANPQKDIRVLHGTQVLRGHGKGVVVAAGENTEYGKVLKQSDRHTGSKSTRTGKIFPLLLILLLPALLIALRSYDGRTVFLFASGVLVFLLLVIQKDTLIKPFLVRYVKRKLLGQNIFLNQAEVLDEIRNVDVFCFDKTGVLTSRDIKVGEIFIGGDLSVNDCGTRPTVRETIMTGCALCHDLAYHQTLGLANSLDRALMSFAEENGTNIDETMHQYQRIYHKPFNSEERYMACGFDHGISGERIYFAKGDPEVLLRKCNSYVTAFGERRPMDFSFLSAVRIKIEEMSRDGSVVIALVYSERSWAKPAAEYAFLCLFRLENPLKPEAKAVLHELSAKGFRNVILTGDRTETALRIVAETGIEDPPRFYLTGANINRMPLSEVARQCEYVSLFTRLSPSQKGIITRIFKQKGHGVAVIGDGTNDVIALKAADVGISFVERSSPVAKRAAKILINDLSDILRIIEAARHARRRFGFVAAGIGAMLVVLLFGTYFLRF